MNRIPEDALLESLDRAIGAFVEAFAGHNWERAERWAEVVFSLTGSTSEPKR